MRTHPNINQGKGQAEPDSMRLYRDDAGQALLTTTQQYHAAFELTQNAIMMIDAETHRIIDANQVAVDAIGASKDKIIGQVCHKYICPTEKGRCPITDFGQSVDAAERVLVNAAGKQIPIQKTVSTTTIGQRRILVESFIDITDRRQSEMRIKSLNRLHEGLLGAGSQAEKLTRITDAVVDMLDADFARIWITKPGDRCNTTCIHAKVTEGPHVCRHRDQCLHLIASSGRYTHLDGAHARVPFGCYKIGLVAAGSEPGFLTNDVVHDPRVHNHQWAQELGLAAFAGYRLTSNAGQPIGVLALFSKNPLTSEDEAILQTIAATSSKMILFSAAEEALQLERDHMLSLFDGIDDIIYVADPVDHTLLYVNTAVQKVFGRDIVGKKCHTILQDRDVPCPFCTNQKIFGDNIGKPHIWEFQNEITHRWYRCTDKAIKWSDDRYVRLEIATDITDEKRFAEERIRLEKFSVLGRLSAGVAHEMNNPLMGILNYAQYCQTKLDSDEKLAAVLRDIEQETKRCIAIVQNLLSASRLDGTSSGQNTAFDADQIIERVLRLMDYRITQENIALSKQIDAAVPKLAMSPDAFQQLCINLLTNAMDAVEDSDQKQISVALSKKPAKVVLSVADSGGGIALDQKDKIFDPFFTTKAPGKGTGLGLTTCWNIAKSNGGEIDCQSRPGLGTTMIVSLPLPNR